LKSRCLRVKERARKDTNRIGSVFLPPNQAWKAILELGLAIVCIACLKSVGAEGSERMARAVRRHNEVVEVDAWIESII
jgi:hypothetical protein